MILKEWVYKMLYETQKAKHAGKVSHSEVLAFIAQDIEFKRRGFEATLQDVGETTSGQLCSFGIDI